MKILRLLLPLLVLAIAAGIGAHFLLSGDPPPRRPNAPAIISVEATVLRPATYPVVIPSQGTVRPRTESTLIPEVSGRILTVSPSFRPGGFFEEGDVLLRIDPADYEAAVVVARATLAQMEASLEIEKAQSQQAAENWKQLGNGEDPSPLVLRKPQLMEATAAVASAQARLDQAERDLKRTRITAPYAGRILQKQVDVGQFVSPGTVLASIYAIDYAEVRLPLSNEQLEFLDVPEQFRGDPAAPRDISGPTVLLQTDFGRRQITWQGTIVRAEGAMDTRSRQLFVVAQITNPYGHSEADAPPLKMGSFVEARIDGRTLTNVFVIPRSAVRRGSEILLVREDDTLERRVIEPVWSDDTHVVVRDGITAGEVLCLTPVPYAADGAKVMASIDGRPPRNAGKPGGRPGAGPERTSLPPGGATKRTGS